MKIRRRNYRAVKVGCMIISFIGISAITTNSYAKESTAPSLATESIRLNKLSSTTKANEDTRTPPEHSPKQLASATGSLEDSLGSVSSWRYEKVFQGGNELTRVSDASGWLATYTKGAHSVAIRGGVRVFAEPAGTSAFVRHNVWVRLLPSPFDGDVDEAWLRSNMTNTSPDVLGIAMQYIAGAPTQSDSSGMVIAGDAAYGPMQADGTRQEGSDFNDYLGIIWNYNGVIDSPEPGQRGALDCSGFVRMILGYRLGLSMSQSIDGTGRLPRRAVQMEQRAPGVVVIPRTGAAQSHKSELLPGDLTFFDVSDNDGADIDHVGIYLGTDSVGNDRFISSRKTADGPTMGDVGGKSVLNGSGMYAKGFAAARRV